MARKIVVTSGKGGVGKTTLCANLGAHLAMMGFRVVLLDVDIGLNNLDVVAGIENRIIYDIVDVIENKCRPKQALVQYQDIPSLYILPSAHSYNVGKVTGENIKAVVGALSPTFDFVLIDCPAGIELGFHRAVFSASEAIVVTTPHISAIRDADKVVSILNSYNMSSISLVINRVRGDLVMGGEMIDVGDIANTLKLRLIGVVPDDDGISRYASLGGAVSAREAKASQAFCILASNLANGTDTLFDYTERYKGFWGAVRRNLKRKV